MMVWCCCCSAATTALAVPLRARHAVASGSLNGSAAADINCAGAGTNATSRSSAAAAASAWLDPHDPVTIGLACLDAWLCEHAWVRRRGLLQLWQAARLSL